MYVQIPPQRAEQLKDELQEGKVYMMSIFNCVEAKTTYRPVESRFIIQFTRFSNDVLRPDLEADYPFCTYNLIPFQDIPGPCGPPPRFLGKLCHCTPKYIKNHLSNIWSLMLLQILWFWRCHWKNNCCLWCGHYPINASTRTIKHKDNNPNWLTVSVICLLLCMHHSRPPACSFVYWFVRHMKPIGARS